MVDKRSIESARAVSPASLRVKSISVRMSTSWSLCGGSPPITPTDGTGAEEVPTSSVEVFATTADGSSPTTTEGTSAIEAPPASFDRSAAEPDKNS